MQNRQSSIGNGKSLHPFSRRRDILQKYEKRVMEEAPYAYKDVEPVVDSVEAAGIAQKVARLWPLCTVKG